MFTLLSLLACDGSSLDTAGPLVNGPMPSVEAPPPALRRLTRSQYDNAIADLLGPELVLPARLEPDTEVDGLFSVGASVATVSPLGVERYEDAAFLLAEQAFADPELRGSLLPCTPSGPSDADCAEDFVADFGLRAWRRPLTEVEVERVAGVILFVAGESGDFDTGAVYGLAAMLQSPSFLYRTEQGEPTQGGGRTLTDWELASRLSFFLWNTVPDEELLAAAGAGELRTDEGLEAQAQRMLADDRARQGLRNFFTEVLKLYELDHLNKDPLVFTHASAELGPAAREETLRVIEHLVLEENGDFRDLMSTRNTFVDRRLAALYGVAAPSEEGFGQVTLPSSLGRRGLLGHTSMLALHAHPTSSSATLRGVWVRRTLLCQDIPSPPGDVDVTVPEPDQDSPTLRDRIAVHLQDPSCAACHELMDPVGLALENFDGIGRWRDTENGALIDASGELDGVGYPDAWGLAGTLREHPDLGPCFTRHLYQYANGKTVSRGEEDLVDWLALELQVSGWSFRELTLAIVRSPTFRSMGALQ